jgi:hypothetical protein
MGAEGHCCFGSVRCTTTGLPDIQNFGFNAMYSAKTASCTSGMGLRRREERDPLITLARSLYTSRSPAGWERELTTRD